MCTRRISKASRKPPNGSWLIPRIGRLQSSSKVHCVANNRNSGVGPVLYFSDNRRSGVDADPQLRSRAVFGFEFGSGFFETLQDRQRSTTRPQRHVLKRNRCTKDGHDAVAGETLNDALEGFL